MEKVIALSGKGGVGKTSISALIVRMLRRDPGKRILAIDGDPAVGFSTALGIEVKRTLDQIRTDVIQTGGSGEKETRTALLQRLEYELADALTERRGFAFLAIGRPEGKGCYCKINEFLKLLIADLAPSFDYIVIDGEAGIEQINRRVMEKVTHLLLVSDASRKGIAVARTIRDVAQTSMRYDRVGLLFNRLTSYDDVAGAETGGLPVIGRLLESDGIRVADIQGKSLLDIPEDAVTRDLDRVLHNFLDL
ncbi:MAG: AAA family ATPase [Oscillospiraceae bacterium]|jgi:CO dehydrogenase maturation factor|nr:AAA family ATPase [Oscillospiraceae bacterium]